MTGDVTAPLGAVGWSVSRGWITSREDLLRAHDAADNLIYVVPDDGVLRDVIGQATVASLMLLDTRMLALLREVDDVRIKVGAAAEDLAQALSVQPPRDDS